MRNTLSSLGDLTLLRVIAGSNFTPEYRYPAWPRLQTTTQQLSVAVAPQLLFIGVLVIFMVPLVLGLWVGIFDVPQHCIHLILGDQ